MDYLSKKDMKAMDDLKASYGGAEKISKTIDERKKLEYRKTEAEKKGFGDTLKQAEEFAKKFPKADAFIKENNVEFTKPAIATSQVSAWQGYKVTLECMKHIAQDGKVLLPLEMISVMPLTEEYIYKGDLLSTLAMCENVMGGDFCITSFVSTPLPKERFDNIEKATGIKIENVDAGDGLRVIPIKNMGTVFGNICGVEVSNNNHLVYLDSVTRTALETGANFFLNPSWSTIVTACYYAKDIKNLSFKISMFLSIQNTTMFRMLLKIMGEFLREDGTSPIREINIGNAVDAENFLECNKILKESGIKGVSLTAHIRINQDLGNADFKWFDNAIKVLDCGCDMTMKYESDGECSTEDTIASYFLSKEDREAKADVLGQVLYRKAWRCSEDAKAVMKLGHKVKFAKISE